MERRREHRGWGGLCLLALASACGLAEDTTLLLADRGAATPAGEEPLDEVSPDAGDTAPAEQAPCAEDGVARDYFIVSTPADIEALAGCREIDGNLSVVAFPSIDTSALGSLRRVTGELSISGTARDEEPHLLDGFRQLESVGGLVLSGLHLTDLAAFGRLRAIDSPPTGPVETYGVPTGALSITQCGGLTSLAGLAALEQVDTIFIAELPELTRLTGLDALRELDGLASYDCPLQDLTGLDRVELGALDLRGSQVRDLSGLHMPGGGLESALQLWANPALTSLGGWQPPAALFEIVLRGNGALVDLRGLEPLSSLYYATIEDEAALTSLEGLEGLVSVGELGVHANARLSSLAGLGSARDIGSLALSGDGALAELSGLAPNAVVRHLRLERLPALSGLGSIGSIMVDSLYIVDVPLVDLQGLEQPTLREHLSLVDLPALVSLAGLSNVADWSTFSLAIEQCAQLRDLAALAPLSALGRLTLDGTDLAELDALANLRQLGSLTLGNNPRLAQINGLGTLERLATLEVSHNPALQALPDFASLTLECSDCPSGVVLVGNAALQSIGPWPWLVSSSFQVMDHPALVSIALPALRSPHLLEVMNNASLTTLDLSSLAEVGTLTVTGNPALDDTEIASLAQARSFQRVKITSNLRGPARLAPCPWLDDGVCDELSEDCAPATDARDCDGLP